MKEKRGERAASRPLQHSPQSRLHSFLSRLFYFSNVEYREQNERNYWQGQITLVFVTGGGGRGEVEQRDRENIFKPFVTKATTITMKIIVLTTTISIITAEFTVEF